MPVRRPVGVWSCSGMGLVNEMVRAVQLTWMLVESNTGRLSRKWMWTWNRAPSPGMRCPAGLVPPMMTSACLRIGDDPIAFPVVAQDGEPQSAAFPPERGHRPGLAPVFHIRLAAFRRGEPFRVLKILAAQKDQVWTGAKP